MKPYGGPNVGGWEANGPVPVPVWAFILSLL